MSVLVEKIIEFGVPKETLILILMLPLIASFLAFCRQIIGIKGFGVFITSIIAFAFAATKLKYGIVIFSVILITGTLAGILIKKIRLLYLSRMALVFVFVSLAIFLMFLFGRYFNVEGLKIISIFPILMMILVMERFILVQMAKGPKEAILMTVETLILAMISYFIINWEGLRNFLLNYPFYFLLTLAIFNFIIGKWTGLRLLEYFRFRKLIKHLWQKK